VFHLQKEDFKIQFTVHSSQFTDKRHYDLLSVDLGWTGKDLRRVALSFLDSKNKKIFCIYKPRLVLKEFLSLIEGNLKPKSLILLDLPLKGRCEGYFRPVERAMQRIGLPCRPSKEALMKGKKLLSKIEALGFKAIEIYPYGFYKFYCMLLSCHAEPCPEPVSWIGSASIDLSLFRRFFPPYKRTGERGLKNAEKVIKELLDFLKLKLIPPCPPLTKRRWGNLGKRWDIYDSVFGAIAGYLFLKHSPWVKIIRDKTGSEILIF
jgi:hypothetical protein